MKIGLYFGSFNPVHHGHLIIGSYFADFTDLDRIWYVVSPQNPLKPQRTLLNEHHRKHLVDLAIENDRRFKASNIEFSLPKPSYTIDTLLYLKEKYPLYTFGIIMGSDSLSNITKWKNYEILLASYPIYVFPRPGFPVHTFVYSTIITADAPLLEISSTLIRELIASGKSIRYFVPEPVQQQILTQNYYRI